MLTRFLDWVIGLVVAFIIICIINPHAGGLVLSSLGHDLHIVSSTTNLHHLIPKPKFKP